MRVPTDYHGKHEKQQTMEAVRIAASIFQVAGAGLALYNYCDAVSLNIRDIVVDIRHTAVVIQEIFDVFREENHKHLVLRRAIKAAAIGKG